MIGRQDHIDDPRFASHERRGEHEAEIDAVATEWNTVALGRTIADDEIRQRLRGHDVDVWMQRIKRWRHRHVGRDDRQQGVEEAIPAYLAQSLAATWAGMA